MEFKKLLEELKLLNLSKKEFSITGSGPLAIRNMREAEDLDLIVKANLWKVLEDKHGSEKGIGGPNVKVINLGNIQIIYSPDSKDHTEKLISNSEIIESFPFISLKDLIERKKSHGREKDFRDIKMIEDYLKNEIKNI